MKSTVQGESSEGMDNPAIQSGARRAVGPIWPASPPRRSSPAVCLALLLYALLCGCAGPVAEVSSQANDQLASGRVLAVVNGQDILSDAFEEFLRLKAVPEAAGLSLKRRTDLFEEFILNILLESQAEQAGIVVEEAEVDAKLDSWNPEGPQPSPQMASEVRRLLRANKLIQSRILPQIEVKLREVQDYYNRHAGDFIAANRLHVLEILVEDRSLLENIRAGLRAGDIRSFKQAARQHSKGVTAQRGGDMGFFEEGVLPKEFERAIFSLKAGEISQPVQTGRGYHLFMLEEQVPQHHQKFYEVQGEIYEKLLAEKERQALDGFLKQILKDASIEVRHEELRAEWRRRHAQPSE